MRALPSVMPVSGALGMMRPRAAVERMKLWENGRSLRVKLNGASSLINEGYWGMNIVKGDGYTFKVAARASITSSVEGMTISVLELLGRVAEAQGNVVRALRVVLHEIRE